jgi:hypothetical protein
MFETAIPELRAALTALVDDALGRMLETGKVEPGLLSLIGGAAAAIAALDARITEESPPAGLAGIKNPATACAIVDGVA